MKKNYLLAGLTVLIWSTMATTVKLLLTDIPNMQALAVSSALAFLFLLLFNIKSGAIRRMRTYSVKQYATMIGLGFVGLFLYSALYYYGLSALSAQEACILNYLWPMMLVLFSCLLLKERLSVPKLLAMLCSFLGIVLLSWGGSPTAGGNALLGMAACILAAACYGLFSVLNKKADLDQGISMMIFWLVAAVCAVPFGLLFEDWQPIRGTQWLGMLWLGVVIDAVAYLWWALSLKGVQNTAKIANLAYLTPFLSLVISAIVLHEPLHLRTLAALILIVGGILWQGLYESMRDKHAKK